MGKNLDMKIRIDGTDRTGQEVHKEFDGVRNMFICLGDEGGTQNVIIGEFGLNDYNNILRVYKGAFLKSKADKLIIRALMELVFSGDDDQKEEE